VLDVNIENDSRLMVHGAVTTGSVGGNSRVRFFVIGEDDNPIFFTKIPDDKTLVLTDFNVRHSTNFLASTNQTHLYFRSMPNGHNCTSGNFLSRSEKQMIAQPGAMTESHMVTGIEITGGRTLCASSSDFISLFSRLVGYLKDK